MGEASRIIVAEACVQALDLEVTKNQVYEVNSVEVNFSYNFGIVIQKLLGITIVHVCDMCTRSKSHERISSLFLNLFLCR